MKEKFDKEYKAIVLGLSTCGLGVIRSLGREDIPTLAIDYETKGREAFYSKYAKSNVCPHPVYDPKKLIKYMRDKFGKEPKKPVLFPTADEFIKFISDYRDELEKCFLFNISSKEIINNIIDKKIQYELAKNVGVNISDTYYVESWQDVLAIKGRVRFPIIIKGRYSFKWREELGGVFKGFKINNQKELEEKCRVALNRNIPIIIQKVILGPNTNHFKFCAYISTDGRFLAKFTLRKIRQYPVEFGVGTCVESIEYRELEEIGEKFFKNIEYRGVGSAEFKLDSEDNKLKLIELNPRYWMQNEQAAYCGVNFALIQYLDLTGQNFTIQEKFGIGVKWIDPVQDFKSFLEQKDERKLSIFYWCKFILHCKIFSVFSWHDLKPFLKSLDFGIKLVKLPLILSKVLVECIRKKSG